MLLRVPIFLLVVSVGVCSGALNHMQGLFPAIILVCTFASIVGVVTYSSMDQLFQDWRITQVSLLAAVASAALLGKKSRNEFDAITGGLLWAAWVGVFTYNAISEMSNNPEDTKAVGTMLFVALILARIFKYHNQVL